MKPPQLNLPIVDSMHFTWSTGALHRVQ